MLSDLKVLMIDTKTELNSLSLLMDEQYDAILNKDIIKMSELDKSISDVTKRVANLELSRLNLLGKGVKLVDVLNDLNDKDLFVLQKDIEVVISMLQIQKDSNVKLLKQLIYFSNKMMNVLKPVDDYTTYNSSGVYK